jgi:hypothetical protein
MQKFSTSGRFSPSLSPNNSEHNQNGANSSSQFQARESMDSYQRALASGSDGLRSAIPSMFQSSHSDRKLSNENETITDDDTPCFITEHKSTACFGNEEEFGRFLNGQGGCEVEKPLETDGGNILVERRKKLGQRKVLKQTIVKKKYGLKQLLASKR